VVDDGLIAEDSIGPADLPAPAPRTSDSSQLSGSTLRNRDRELIGRALCEHGGNVSAAAQDSAFPEASSTEDFGDSTTTTPESHFTFIWVEQHRYSLVVNCRRLHQCASLVFDQLERRDSGDRVVQQD
jgi:hypothetical protein